MILNSLLYNGLNETHFHINAQTRGIRRRYNKFQTNWLPHLNNSKTCILNWLSTLADKSEFQVLGAGELLDFPIDPILNSFKKIYLTDINIACLPIWERFQKQYPKIEVIPVFQDVSTCLNNWAELVIDLQGAKIEDYLIYLQTIPRIHPTIENPFIKTANVVSLNLLSQLPIVWQEFVFGFLVRKFGQNKVNQNSDKILTSLIPSAHQLITSHIRSLVPERSGSSLLLTDLKYFFPDNSNIQFTVTQNKNSPKVNLTNKTGKPCTVLEQDALYGFDLNKGFNVLGKTWKLTSVNSWIWDLVPKATGLEKLEFHLVSGMLLENGQNPT